MQERRFVELTRLVDRLEAAAYGAGKTLDLAQGRPDTDLVLTLQSISSPRAVGGKEKETAMIGSRNLCCAVPGLLGGVETQLFSEGVQEQSFIPFPYIRRAGPTVL